MKLEPETYRVRARDCSCGMAVCRCPVDVIVFYTGDGQWIVARTSDKAELARGHLDEMMELVSGPNPKFNGRRAHLAEDMLRPPATPRMFFQQYEFPV